MKLRFSQLAVSLLVLTCFSCSTQKNTFVSRQYHNLTAFYNYYYNANDIYKLSIKKAEKGFTYNYTLPVPMLLLGEEQIINGVGSDMDRAIDKCTNLIAKHSITIKPQRSRGLIKGEDKKFYNQSEFVKYAREAWLLAAKSQAWKGDFEKSQLAFEYISLRFPNTEMWFTAQVWLARLATLKSDFVGAGEKLNEISENRRRPRNSEFKHLLASTYAFFYLKQNKVEEAIPYIATSVENASKRSDKMRYTYLLAQLQQQIGDKDKASKNYAKALKLNPSYEMAFSIKINMIALGGVKGADLKRELKKLAKDDKNRDYLDQLYYALGNLEAQENNMPQAIEYYKLSAQKSTQNNNQKGMSYLVLANYYFNGAQYTQAQGYFDSTIVALDKNYPNYEEIATKSRFLNKLVENINTVNLEDSLLRVAAMPKAERDLLIANLIKKVQEEEEAKKLIEQEERQRALQYQQSQQYNRNTTDTEEAGKWYFYNQVSLSYGLSEFQLKWGKRKLEDNWRRKNKSQIMDVSSATDVSDTSNAGSPLKGLSNKSPEFYLATLPMTDSLKAVSQRRIKESMLKIAEIYQLDLNDLEEAKKSYQKYIDRYSAEDDAAAAYYNLYKIAMEQNNTTLMQSYKASMASKYPKSPYTLMLINPSYVESLKTQQNKLESHYQSTYDQYRSGNYSKALADAREGRTLRNDLSIAPKYMLIEALCSGKLHGSAEMKRILADLIKTYPKTEEEQQALQIIQVIEAQELQLASGKQEYEKASADTVLVQRNIYLKPQGEHALVILVPKDTDINQFKFNVISFNVDHFIETDLNVSNVPFTDFVELVLVSGLKDGTIAMKYYNQLIQNERTFGNMKKDDYQIFVISIENYAKFIEDKSIPDYLRFFKQNYQ